MGQTHPSRRAASSGSAGKRRAPRRKKSNTGLLIGLGVGAGMVLLAMVGIIVWAASGSGDDPIGEQAGPTPSATPADGGAPAQHGPPAPSDVPASASAPAQPSGAFQPTQPHNAEQPPQAAAATDPATALQGKWQVFEQVGATAIGTEYIEGQSWTFTGNRFQLLINGRVIGEGTFKVDSSRTPNFLQVKFRRLVGKHAGREFESELPIVFEDANTVRSDSGSAEFPPLMMKRIQ